MKKSNTLTEFKNILLTKADVVRVIAVRALSDSQMLYFIKTPYHYPRYVIGRSDKANEYPQPFFGSGKKWSAMEYWHQLQTSDILAAENSTSN